MENGIFERLDVVKEYGSNEQIRHFEKWGKWKNKDTQVSFEKTLDEIFGDGNWETVKDGRKTMYKLSEKLIERAIRDDKRVSNGAWKIPYTKNLDTMVVAVLELGIEKEDAQTLSNWSVDFGAITLEQHDILTSRYHDGLRQYYVNDALGKKVIFSGEERVFDDYALFIKELTQQIAGTLNRMEKLGIIDVSKVYNGWVEGKKEPIELHYTTYKKILELRRTLLEQYDLNEWYLETYKNAKKSVEYYKNFKEQLAQITDEDGNILNLTNYYITYAIMLKARKKKILRYLEKYNPEAIEQFNDDKERFLLDNKKDFGEKRIKHIENEAQKKVDSFMLPRVFNGEMIKEIGGKINKRQPMESDYTYDKEYYNLYFDDLLTKRMLDLEKLYGYDFSK